MDLFFVKSKEPFIKIDTRYTKVVVSLGTGLCGILNVSRLSIRVTIFVLGGVGIDSKISKREREIGTLIIFEYVQNLFNFIF